MGHVRKPTCTVRDGQVDSMGPMPVRERQTCPRRVDTATDLVQASRASEESTVTESRFANISGQNWAEGGRGQWRFQPSK